MKRSEFGFKEWCEFAPMHAHTFRCNGGLFYVSLNEFHATSLNLDDACRVSVERFTESRIGYDIPWESDKPDFSAWTREQCEEFILGIDGGALINMRTDTRTDNIPATSICVAFKNLHANFGSDKVGPTLKDYQDAAEYVWTKVNK